MNAKTAFTPVSRPPAIVRIRDVNAILDSDLAAALGMQTKRPNHMIGSAQAVPTIDIKADQLPLLSAQTERTRNGASAGSSIGAGRQPQRADPNE